MKKVIPALAIVSAVMLGGCGLNEKTDRSKPVIKVNNSVITQKAVDSAIKKESAMLGNLDKNKEEDKFLYLIYKNKAVNDLIIKELLNQEAAKRKISVSDEEIDAKTEEIIENVGGKEKFESYFTSGKIDKNDFREKIRLDLMNEKIVEDLAGEKITSEKEAKEFYEKHRDEYFKHPEQVKASHILISASEPMIRAKIQSESEGGKTLSPEETDKRVKEELSKAEDKAKKILAELKENPDRFEELARKESQDPSSAKRGGDLGFFSKEKMVPSFSKAAFDLKPGEISGIVKTEYGYHIIKAVDRKEAGVVPFDEVKEQIEKYLVNKKKTLELRQMITGLKNKAKIEFLDDEYNPEKIQEEIKEHMEKQKKKKAEEKEKSTRGKTDKEKK